MTARQRTSGFGMTGRIRLCSERPGLGSEHTLTDGLVYTFDSGEGK